VLTVTRSCLARGSAGGRSQKVPLPSRVATDTLHRLRLPAYSAPVSSVAVTRKDGVMKGHPSPMPQGYP